MDEEEFQQHCLQVQTLELFIHSLPEPELLADYPRLRELALHMVQLPQVVGVRGMTQLQRLAVTECGLESMSGIENCHSLTSLDLSQNRLEEMDCAVLANLTQLQSLWLNQNRITAIQGLEPLSRLSRLWLARNEITSICDSLDSNLALTELNLAGTQISNFKDVPNLARLRRLGSLCMSDPHFGESPVCALCNYQTYMLYHLQQLSMLDSYAIADEARHLAEATYMKKKMYYNMRIKTLKRNTSNVIKKAMEARQARAASPPSRDDETTLSSRDGRDLVCDLMPRGRGCVALTD